MFIIMIIISEKAAEKVVNIFSCDQESVPWLSRQPILSRKYVSYELRVCQQNILSRAAQPYVINIFFHFRRQCFGRLSLPTRNKSSKLIAY